MFEPFQNFLAKATKEYGVTRQVQAATVCHSFNGLIPYFFNNPAAIQNIKAAFYKDTILMVETSSPAWAMELNMRSEKILSELNNKVSTKISAIKTRPISRDEFNSN